MTEKNIPVIPLLKAIAPCPESVRAETLQYANLEPLMNQHSPYEYSRIHRFWDAEPDSFEEQGAARQLALHYVVMGSAALNQSLNARDVRNLSSWYTRATSELYGLPDATVARQLFYEQQTGTEQGKPFERLAHELGRFLDDEYSDVYEEIFDLREKDEGIQPEEIANLFERALIVLAENHDDSWGDWSVNRNEKDMLSVTGSKKLLEVGLNRAPVSREQLKALFTHEVLVHALRAVNGAKLSEELASGLPNYLDIEEGFGIFAEFASIGSIKDVVYDRYVDIAYATGLVDGAQHTRSELIEVAMQRAKLRNGKSDRKKTQEVLEKEIYAHVNRIYRGSKGDQNIGIFTKDISYYEGFLKIGKFIEGERNKGKSIEDIWRYLTQGKFDPTSAQHISYVDSVSV